MPVISVRGIGVPDGSGGDANSAFQVVFEEFDIAIDHDFYQIDELRLRLPAEFGLCFGRIADEQIDLCGAVISGVDFHIFFPVQSNVAKRSIQKLTDRFGKSFRVLTCSECHNGA